MGTGFMNFAGSSAGQAAGGIASSLISSIASSITANRQNRKNREFQAKQAQLARDWQEDMYNKYSSPSAMVKQYQEAGLNPALALGGQGQTFTGTSGMTSGSQMMPDYSGLDLSGIFTALAGLNIEAKKADASVKRDVAEANYFDKRSEGLEIDNEFKPKIYNQDLRQGELDIVNTEKGIKLAETQIDLNNDELLNNLFNRHYTLAKIYNENAKTVNEILKQGLIKAQTYMANTQGDLNTSLKNSTDKDVTLKGYTIAREDWLKQFRDIRDIDVEAAKSQWALALMYVNALDKEATNSLNSVLDFVGQTYDEFTKGLKELIDQSKDVNGSSRIQNNE